MLLIVTQCYRSGRHVPSKRLWRPRPHEWNGMHTPGTPAPLTRNGRPHTSAVTWPIP